jgi:asparagine N-glycosylation enzyme membrane subunit Stt3
VTPKLFYYSDIGDIGFQPSATEFVKSKSNCSASFYCYNLWYLYDKQKSNSTLLKIYKRPNFALTTETLNS